MKTSLAFSVRAPALERSLKTFRTEQALTRTVPPVSVFDNSLLRGIVHKSPTTMRQLCSIRGMGVKRCEQYGADILKLVNMSIKGKTTRKCPKKPQKKAKPQKAKPRKTTKALKVVTSRFFPTPLKPPLPVILPQLMPPQKRFPPSPGPSVYILELEQGRVYVGSSRDVDRRVAQHMAGAGSAYTRVYRPTGVLLPRLGNVGGEGDAAERDETLRYMMMRGIPYVRGWKFAQVVMSPEDFNEAESNIRELFDLCRRCGYKGHFITRCKATYDRWGNVCK